MTHAWITRRYRLDDTQHHLEDEDGVLAAEALRIVVDAAALTREVRARCAARVRASRTRQQAHLRRQREACEARVLARAAELSRALQDERRGLRDTAGELVTQVARDALKRLMVELPEAWPAQSSVQLVLDEWASLDLKDEAVLSVHPDDLPLLQARQADAPWALKADPDLARGACVLSHSAGTVHADFRANVEALHAALLTLGRTAANTEVASDPLPTPSLE